MAVIRAGLLLHTLTAEMLLCTAEATSRPLRFTVFPPQGQKMTALAPKLHPCLSHLTGRLGALKLERAIASEAGQVRSGVTGSGGQQRASRQGTGQQARWDPREARLQGGSKQDKAVAENRLDAMPGSDNGEFF